MTERYAKALELAEEMLVDKEGKFNLELLSEMIGESDRVATAFARMFFAPTSGLQDAQKSAHDAIIAYLRTDVEAEDIFERERNTDWLESSASRGGLINAPWNDDKD